MPPERATLPQLVQEYTDATREAQKLAFLVRHTELQAAKVKELTSLKQRFRGFKVGARQAKDEGATNAIFHMQCGISAMISFPQCGSN